MNHSSRLPFFLRARRFRLAAWCVTVLLAPLPAGAVGLGSINTSPVMGESLALEIPLIEPGTLSIDCFQLSAHPNGSDSQYFPRRAKLDLKKKADGTMSLVLQGSEFNQPVIEFRIGISCGTQVARDYVLLLSPSRELRYEPVALTRPATAPVTQAPPPVTATPSASDLAAKPGPSIEQMAGSRFPQQSKERQRFKRELRAANAAKLKGVADNAPIPLNVELTMPDETTKPRAARALTPPPPVKKRPAPKPRAPKPVTAAPAAVAVPPPPPAKPVAAPVVEEKPKDRLTISTGVGTEGATQPVGAADGALQAKAESSFTSQEAMAEKLAKTEASYNELKEQIQRMENRLIAMEQERAQLQEENRKQTDWSVLVGALSILGGGIFGALLMMVIQRRGRRSDYNAPVFDINDLGKK